MGQKSNIGGGMNKNMLFSKIEDCSECPFSVDNAEKFNSYWVCNGSPDIARPCEFMEEYENMTLKEVVQKENARILAAQARYYKEQDKQRVIKEKRDNITKKKAKTRSENWEINHEISKLRQKIKKMEDAIDSINGICEAVVFANEIMNCKEKGKKPIEPEQVKIWRQEIIKDKNRLQELILERDRKNKERRKANK